jgi:hypothetical protein
MPLRDIIESTAFKLDLEMYQRNYPDLEQVYEAIKEILLDKPSIGTPLKIPRDFRVYTTEPVADIDGVTQGFYVVYRYDLNHIYMEEIGKVDF